MQPGRVLIWTGGIGGQASDIDIQAREILKLRRVLNSILASHTGQSVEKIEQDTDRDFFMGGQEAVEYGLVDEAFEHRPSGIPEPK